MLSIKTVYFVGKKKTKKKHWAKSEWTAAREKLLKCVYSMWDRWKVKNKQRQQKKKVWKNAAASVNGIFCFSLLLQRHFFFIFMLFFDEIDIKHKTDSRRTSVTTQSQRMQVECVTNKPKQRFNTVSKFSVIFLSGRSFSVAALSHCIHACIQLKIYVIWIDTSSKLKLCCRQRACVADAAFHLVATLFHHRIDHKVLRAPAFAAYCIRLSTKWKQAKIDCLKTNWHRNENGKNAAKCNECKLGIRGVVLTDWHRSISGL